MFPQSSSLRMPEYLRFVHMAEPVIAFASILSTTIGWVCFSRLLVYLVVVLNVVLCWCVVPVNNPVCFFPNWFSVQDVHDMVSRDSSWNMFPCILTQKAQWASFIRLNAWTILRGRDGRCPSILDMLARDKYVMLPPRHVAFDMKKVVFILA